MYLTRLEQFKCIAECGSISKAAKKLYISHSALSQALQKLEKDLDIKLFDRNKNSISLNPAGEIVLEYVNNIMKELEMMRISLGNYANRISNKINIYSASPACLRHCMQKFIKHLPEFSMLPGEIEESELEEALLNKTAQMTISITPILHTDICCVPIMELKWFVSVPFTHSFAKRDAIRIDELEKQEILIPRININSLLEIILNLMKEKNINPDFIFVDDYVAFREIVPTSNYLVVATTLVSDFYNSIPTRRNIPFEDLESTVTVYLAYLKENATLAKPFMNCVCNLNS